MGRRLLSPSRAELRPFELQRNSMIFISAFHLRQALREERSLAYTHRGSLGLGYLWGEEDAAVVFCDSSGGADRFCHDIGENAVILDSPADHPRTWIFGGKRLVMSGENRTNGPSEEQTESTVLARPEGGDYGGGGDEAV